MPEWHLKDSRAAGMVAHSSTELALHALHSSLVTHHSPLAILDIGCGSGLLSLAAAERWPEARILAADISEQAVADASENFNRFRGAPSASTESYSEHDPVLPLSGPQDLTVLRADGLSHPEITAHAPYGLTLCNLLAEKIIALLPELARHLAPGGQLITSGILAWQLPQLLAAARTLSFEIIEELSHGPWRALVVKKPS